MPGGGRPRHSPPPPPEEGQRGPEQWGHALGFGPEHRGRASAAAGTAWGGGGGSGGGGGRGQPPEAAAAPGRPRRCRGGTFWPCRSPLREGMLLLVPAWDAKPQLGQKGLKREEKEITAPPPNTPISQPAPETKQTSPEQRVPRRQLSATGRSRYGAEEKPQPKAAAAAARLGMPGALGGKSPYSRRGLGRTAVR